MSENTIIKMIRSIAGRASKNTEFGAYNAIRSHTMRKVFGSVLTNNGCPEQVKEYLLGHAQDNTTAAYWTADVSKLRDQYQKYIPYLTIEKSLDVSVAPEYKKLVEEKQRLEAEVVRVSVERNELQRVGEELQALQAKYERMNQIYTEMFENTEPDQATLELFKKNKEQKRGISLLPDDGSGEISKSKTSNASPESILTCHDFPNSIYIGGFRLLNDTFLATVVDLSF